MSPSRQHGDPVAQERGWACRRPPSSWGLEAKHRRALCSHEGPAGGGGSGGVGGWSGGNRAQAEFVSQPRFLSVVLKESVESADWAVLLHPRTEAAAAPGRERGEAPQGSSHLLLVHQLRLPGFEDAIHRMGGSLGAGGSPGSEAAGSWDSPLLGGGPSCSRILHQVLWPQFSSSSSHACGEGWGDGLFTQNLSGFASVMSGHPSHPDPALTPTPTSCHPAGPQRVTTALSSSASLLPVTSSVPVSPCQPDFPDLPTQSSSLSPHPAFVWWHLSPWTRWTLWGVRGGGFWLSLDPGYLPQSSTHGTFLFLYLFLLSIVVKDTLH